MNLHHGIVPSCIGRIVEMHATYYGRTFGFGIPFEAKVATEFATFCVAYDPVRDGLWLAREGETIHGSVAIDGSHHLTDGAHLRWFVASDESRGTGVGNMLLDAAMAFCRERGYRRVYLWTFDDLAAARHLYEKHGFRLDLTQRGSQWGKEVNEQRFVLGGPS
jgi:GNAT superfamily N-acetyltransferase